MPFANAMASELKLDIAFDPPVHSETSLGDVLAIPHTLLLSPPGAPLLPERTFTFALPQGHTPVGLRLESIQVEALPGVFDIAPAQRPVPLSWTGVPSLTPRDPAIYGITASFPSNWAVLGPVQWKRGYAMAGVSVHPLRFDPRSGKVLRLRSVTLVLTTEPLGPISPLLRAEPADLELVRRQVDVREPLTTYTCRVPRTQPLIEQGSSRYLIVAPEAFTDLGGPLSLEALRDSRIALGMSASIVTLEWIRTNYPGTRPDGGSDDATRIREFLTDAYTEWGTSYVLLVGDADANDQGGESGDNLLPVRGLRVDVQDGSTPADDLPSDLYYSCLDGTFDDNANGIYGEPGDGPSGGEVDLAAELFVGRAPADSAIEAENFVQKTLAYETGAGTWLQTVWGVGEMLFEDPPTYGGPSIDEIWSGSSASGFLTLGFASFPFFEAHTLYDSATYSFTTGEMVEVLNAGPHIVNHLGHSNLNENMRLGIEEVDGLVNPHPFFHYSQGCYNGAFDDYAGTGGDPANIPWPDDCIAEHMVLGAHGAFASVSNSRYGWTTYLGTDSPSQLFHRLFWNAFFAKGVSTFGQALAASKEDAIGVVGDAYYRWVYYESNLLGDPAVALKKNINTSSPLLGVYPPVVNFVSIAGGAAPAPASVRVINDGIGSLSWSAAADQTWVALEPAAAAAPAEVQVRIDPSGLAPGTHTALVTFSSGEATNSPVTLAVSVLVVAVPEVRVPHVALAPEVDGAIGQGEYDHALALEAGANAAGDATLYLSIAGSRLYIAVDDRADTTAGQADQLRLYFDKNLDDSWPESAPSDEGYYSLSSRSSTATFMPVFNDGGGATADRRYRVRNPQGFSARIGFADGHRVYEAALDLEASMLDVGPAGAFGLVVQTSNSDQYGSGNLTGSWPTVIPEIDDQLFFGHVDATPDTAWLHGTPGSIHLTGIASRASPAPVEVLVTELLGDTVAFTASVEAPWLRISPAAGSTPALLTLTADTAGLALGTYTDTLVLASAETGNPTLPIAVTLDVVAAPELEVDPASLAFTAVQGETGLSATLTIANTGGAPTDVELASSATWLSPSPSSFRVDAGREQEVTVTVDLTGLEAGTHAAELSLSSADAEGGPIAVPVALTLLRPAELLVAPAALSAQAMERDPDPVRSLTVRNGGDVEMVVQLKSSAAWLTVDKLEFALGAGLEQVVNVTASLNGLPLGTETAEIAIAAAGAIPGSVTVPFTLELARWNSAPPAPSLLSPASNRELTGLVELTALTVDDPEGDQVTYQFELLEADQVVDAGLGTEGKGFVSFRPTLDFVPGAEYAWRVTATDNRGARGAPSETWTFTYGAASEGCGCQSTGSVQDAVFSLGLLSLLCLSRRRSRHGLGT